MLLACDNNWGRVCEQGYIVLHYSRSQASPVFPFLAVSSASVYYTEWKPKNKRTGEAWEQAYMLYYTMQKPGVYSTSFFHLQLPVSASDIVVMSYLCGPHSNLWLKTGNVTISGCFFLFISPAHTRWTWIVLVHFGRRMVDVCSGLAM